MNTKFVSAGQCLTLAILLFLIPSCWGEPGKALYVLRVEIAPDIWLPLRQQGGYFWFRCNWKGKEVYWEEDPELLEVPASLRSHNDTLYLVSKIVSQKSVNGIVPPFRYFVLDQTGTRFMEIPKAEFPRQIASINLMHPKLDDEHGSGAQVWESTRNLDYKAKYFWTSLTGRLWKDLSEDYVRANILGKKLPAEEYQAKLHLLGKEFVEKYKPIPLKHMVNAEDWAWLVH